MNKRTDKRARLIEAADTLFYEQGVNTTTLANIAALADVPLGNVYYYFKSKESIVMAVILRRREMMHTQFNTWDTLPHKERLTSFVTHHMINQAQTATFGDWLGSLCQELCKQTGEISTAASDLLRDMLKWCTTQFKELGKGEQSERMAHKLLSSLQGISLLTLTLKDPKILEEQNQQLVGWLESL